jgi:hypothetical protein
MASQVYDPEGDLTFILTSQQLPPPNDPNPFESSLFKSSTTAASSAAVANSDPGPSNTQLAPSIFIFGKTALPPATKYGPRIVGR